VGEDEEEMNSEEKVNISLHKGGMVMLWEETSRGGYSVIIVVAQSLRTAMAVG